MQNTIEAAQSFLKREGFLPALSPLGPMKNDLRKKITEEKSEVRVILFAEESGGGFIVYQDWGEGWKRLADGAQYDTLEAELESLGLIPHYCENCGEPGGEPRTGYVREYQGVSPHGGMVTWEDKGCSLCIKGRGYDYIQ